MANPTKPRCHGCMPVSKRASRKAKKEKAIELVLTDPCITQSYERKVARVLEEVHEEPLISYPWSIKKVANDKEEIEEDWKQYISDSGECPVFAKQAPEEPIAESFIAESFIAVLIRFIAVMLSFIASKIANITMEEPTIEEPIAESFIEEPIAESFIEEPEGMVLVRFIMVGFPRGVDAPKKSMKLGFDTAQEMMEKACSEFALDYEKSSMIGPKVVMLPFQSKHEDHVSWFTAQYLKTISTYDDIMNDIMVESFKKGGNERTHVFGIDVFIVNTKNKIAMQYYDNANMMARVIAYNDDSIERFKKGRPDVWEKVPVIPFFDLYETGAVNRPMHVDI